MYLLLLSIYNCICFYFILFYLFIYLFIICKDPDDEIIANLSSLKNGVAMRLVMGDLSWKMVAEPWEYTYSVYQKAVLPFLDREADLLEKVMYPLL